MNKTYKAILTGEEYEGVAGIKMCKFLKVLEALLWGLEVEINGHLMRLFETNNNGYSIATVHDGDKIQGHPYLTFTELSELCNEISDDYFETLKHELAASKILTGIRCKGDF